MHSEILVLGAGSWGTALAMVLARNGGKVRLWARDPEQLKSMTHHRQNLKYLPDIPFPLSLQIVGDWQPHIHTAQDLIIAVPSHHFRSLLEQLAPHLENKQLCWATKGIEEGTGTLLHQVVQQTVPKLTGLGVLSGPSFATEVARELPTAVTVATNSLAYAYHLVTLFHNRYFRLYTSLDMIGVQIGGAVKNSIAIAAGIADGLGFGANTQAALITRGLAEMVRLGTTLGGQRETFMGLAGLGDLVLTCTDNQSRNRRFGRALARGYTVSQAQASIGQVVEGIRATSEIYRLAQQHAILMPIVEQIYHVLEQHYSPQEAVHNLLDREPKSE